MNGSVLRALDQHVTDLINDGVINDTNKDDWHDIAFFHDFYMSDNILEPEEWLKVHDINPWDAIKYVIDSDYEYNGYHALEMQEITPEQIVNWVAFFWSMKLDFDAIYEKAKMQNMTITVKNQHSFKLPPEAKPSDILILREDQDGHLVVDYKGEEYTSYSSDCVDMEFNHG